MFSSPVLAVSSESLQEEAARLVIMRDGVFYPAYKVADLQYIDGQWVDSEGGEIPGFLLAGNLPSSQSDIDYLLDGLRANDPAVLAYLSNNAGSLLDVPGLFENVLNTLNDVTRNPGVFDLPPEAAAELREVLFDSFIQTEYANRPPLDFSEVDISGRNFDGIDLRNTGLTGEQIGSAGSFAAANLSGLNLDGMTASSNQDFTDAILQGTSLRNTSLDHANFTGADLSGADLSGGLTSLEGTQFTGANLSDASLPAHAIAGTHNDWSGVNLSNVDVNGASFAGKDLSNSTLTNAVLSNTNLMGADFSGSSITGTNFSNSTLTASQLAAAGNDLTGTNLDSTNLAGADFTSKILNNTSLQGADLTLANFGGTDLRTANLSNSNFSGSTFDGANMNGTVAENADFSGVDFSSTDLANSRLAGSNLSGSNLSGTSLAGADLSGVEATNADFSGTDTTNTAFSGADLRGSNITADQIAAADKNFSGSNLSELDLQGADFSDFDFSGADLTNTDLSGSTVTNSDFSGADLRGSNITAEQIADAGTSLAGSNLSGMDLRGIDLASKDLTGTILENVDLRDAILPESLVGVNVSGANMSGVNLVGRDFSNAQLASTDLSGSDVSNATFAGSNYLESNISKAQALTTNISALQYSELTDLEAKEYAFLSSGARNSAQAVNGASGLRLVSDAMLTQVETAGISTDLGNSNAGFNISGNWDVNFGHLRDIVDAYSSGDMAKYEIESVRHRFQYDPDAMALIAYFDANPSGLPTTGSVYNSLMGGDLKNQIKTAVSVNNSAYTDPKSVLQSAYGGDSASVLNAAKTAQSSRVSTALAKLNAEDNNVILSANNAFHSNYPDPRTINWQALAASAPTRKTIGGVVEAKGKTTLPGGDGRMYTVSYTVRTASNGQYEVDFSGQISNYITSSQGAYTAWSKGKYVSSTNQYSLWSQLHHNVGSGGDFLARVESGGINRRIDGRTTSGTSIQVRLRALDTQNGVTAYHREFVKKGGSVNHNSWYKASNPSVLNGAKPQYDQTVVAGRDL